MTKLTFKLYFAKYTKLTFTWPGTQNSLLLGEVHKTHLYLARYTKLTCTWQGTQNSLVLGEVLISLAPPRRQVLLYNLHVLWGCTLGTKGDVVMVVRESNEW